MQPIARGKAWLGRHPRLRRALRRLLGVVQGRPLRRLRLKADAWWRRRRGSYSQYGEDLVVDRLLGHRDAGLYVDVGAFDPTVRSNTRRFYERGWHGVNIEPIPDRFQRFVEQRDRDININCGVSDEPGVLTLYEIDRGSGSFDLDAVRRSLDAGGTVTATYAVPVRRLAAVLDDCGVDHIDLLTVDAEGLDLSVLRSNDWTRFRPTLVLVEVNSVPQAVTYMEALGYTLVFHNGTNAIFQRPGDEEPAAGDRQRNPGPGV